jgi:hypothetical protein
MKRLPDMSLHKAILTKQVQAKTVLATKVGWLRTSSAPEWTSSGGFQADEFLKEQVSPRAHF